MRLLLVDTQNAEMFFQVTPSENEGIKEMLADEEYGEISKDLKKLKVNIDEMLKAKDIVKQSLEKFVKKVDTFNIKYNPDYVPHKQKIQI